MEGNLKFTYSSMAVFILFLLLIASSAVLQGCSKSQVESFHAGAKHHLDREKDTPDSSFLGMDIQPIQPDDEEFHKAAGWLTNGSILYITNKGEGSSLYSYSLGSGKSEILYKSDIPIVTAEISPDKEMVLVHRAVSNKGVLTIIDLEGKEIYSDNIESYELNFEWNPFNRDLIAVSAFTEDWNFKTFLLNLKQNKIVEHEIPEPFLRWVSDHEFAYQEWEKDSMTLQAPMKIMSIKNNKSERSLESVYRFDTLGKYLLTVAVEDENDLHRSQYTLYSEGLKQLASFDVPLLTSFSGWLVPFYDLMDDSKYFLYLRALHEGEADIYEDGFELVRYELDTQEEEVIFTGLNNENISCSPSGKMCLYGFQLERVINIDSKEMTELIQ